MSLKSIKKILIARSDNLGDNILTLPLLSATKNSFPESEIHLLTSQTPSELFQNINFIDELIVKEKENLKPLFEKERYDLFIAARPQSDEAFTAFRSKVNYRVGTAFRIFSLLYNVRVAEHRKDCKLHESEYNLNLLKSIVPDAEYEKFFDFNLKENTLTKYSLTDVNYIVVHPGSKGSSYDLPKETLVEFLRLYLSSENSYKVILTGSEQEKKLCDDIINSLGSEFEGLTINLSGKLNIRELAELIKHCSLFISNSTGPIHIAGVMNKNIIGFYPDVLPIKPSRWKPLSDNSVILTPGLNQSDMKKITAEEIFKNAELLLKSR